MGKLTLLNALVLLLAGNALADVVASQSGPDNDNWSLDNGQTLAVSWTSSSDTYSNVTIDVTLNGASGEGDTVQAYLTDLIGTGATSGNVLATNTFVYTAGSQDETFTAFSGLTLDPGTYYLVLYDPGASGNWWGSDTAATQTTAPGVTIASDEFANQGDLDTTNPYASTFHAFALGLHFTVTGDVESGETSPVPEPSSLVGLGALFAGVVGFKIRRALKA